MAALPPLDAAETAATLKKVSHDLSFLFADLGMAPGLQLLFARTGFLTMILFTAVSDSRAELRLLLSEDYGLDPADGAITPLERITRRAQAAAVINCWEAAKRRVDEKDKLAASQVASRFPTTLLKSEHLALRKRYGNDYGAVPDKGYPCPTLIEKRFQGTYAIACVAPAAPASGSQRPPVDERAERPLKKFEKGIGGRGGGRQRRQRSQAKENSRKGKGAKQRSQAKKFRLHGHSRTPNGRKICCSYNSGKTCNGSCGMVHCCQYCMGRHPKSTCTIPAPKAAARPGKGGKPGATPALALAAGEVPQQ
jgi:hypothetical protein